MCNANSILYIEHHTAHMLSWNIASLTVVIKTKEIKIERETIKNQDLKTDDKIYCYFICAGTSNYFRLYVCKSRVECYDDRQM